MKKIRIEDLKYIFLKVVEKLNSEPDFIDIEIDQDFYLFIPPDNWRSYEQKALAGSLFDDVEELEKLVLNPEHEITYVDFDRVASILHYISEKMNPVNGQ